MRRNSYLGIVYSVPVDVGDKITKYAAQTRKPGAIAMEG
jgi:hypothetical protein